MADKFGLRGIAYYPERAPFPGEDEYFKANPHVGGMAAEDDKVVLNPYSTLSTRELDAIRMNESARIHMRKNGAPKFKLTEKQRAFLDSNTYKNASEDDRNSTIAARILSGDPSAHDVTDEQLEYVNGLREGMSR